MGVCISSLTPEEREAVRRNREVEMANAEGFQRDSKTIKLLLLGAGSSGKSTIFKQMKLLHGVISEKERQTFTTVMYTNAVDSMKTLVTKAEHLGYRDSLTEEGKAAVAVLDEASPGKKVGEELGGAIKTLWLENAIQMTFERRSEFQLCDSAQYVLKEIDRIMQDDYVASVTDVLHARVRSSGIVTECYKINGSLFEMYDVGGQRNERRKWIHCFDDVSAVIFVVAISEFDQTLFEDPDTNRIVEAIHLFRDICNNQAFMSSSMILFLNKKDLYYEKIERKAIASVKEFSDYDGPEHDRDAGIEFFLRKFLEVNENPGRRIYHHVTCATDTHNVNHVFNICVDMIVRSSLNDSGFVV